MGRHKLSSLCTCPYPPPVPPHLADGSSKHQGPVRQPGTAREHEGIGSQAIERQYIEHVHQHLRTHSQQDEQLPQMGLLRPPQVGAPGRIWPVSDPTQDGGSLYIPPCANCTSISFSYPPPHRHTEPFHFILGHSDQRRNGHVLQTWPIRACLSLVLKLWGNKGSHSSGVAK